MAVPTGTGDLAIDLAHVAKTYRTLLGKKTPALRGIEMRVHRGEVFGLLGPNGAGKSTLVKILMTVIRPSACSGSMLGGRIGHKPTLARVGYLPEHHSFPGYLTGAQIIDFFGAMAGVERRDRRRRSGELLELVGMAEWSKRKLRSYSKGMRQRIGIAQSLINDPELILLDEPTDGVDPVGRRDIRDVIQRLKEQNKTVFINSHLLSELEMVCDRVAILVKGVVAQQGSLDELTIGQRRYEIDLAGADDDAIGRVIEKTPGVERRGSGLRIPTTDADEVQPVIDRLRAAGLTIAAVRPVRPSLEDLFMQAVTDPTTGETLRPGAAEAERRRR
ncbi:MAG: ABC transporter ATP-binding protein [Phycisphaerales bacterium]